MGVCSGLRIPQLVLFFWNDELEWLELKPPEEVCTLQMLENQSKSMLAN